MTAKTFKSLKIGDKVTLSVSRDVYYFDKYDAIRRKIPDHPYCPCVPAGTVGIIGAVKVPAVMTRNGRDRYFVCVDFPDNPIKTKSFSGKDISTIQRVAAYSEELV